MTVTEKKTSQHSDQGSAAVAELASNDFGINTPDIRKVLQSKILETASGAFRDELPAHVGTHTAHQQKPPNINQPFLADLNKEAYPKPIDAPREFKDLGYFQSQPQSRPELPPQEGSLYSATFTPVNADATQAGHQFSSFTLKGTTNTNVDLLLPAEASRVLYLPQIAQQALKLVEKFHNFVPDSASFDTARGELSFTHSGQQFVASPEYVLIRKDDTQQRALLEKQAAEQSKNLSDKLAVLFRDHSRTWAMDDAQKKLSDYQDTQRTLDRRIASELRKIGESVNNLSEDLKPGMKEYDLLSTDLQSEVDSWRAGKQDRIEQRTNIRIMSTLAQSLDDTKASLTSLGVFEGHLSDGRRVEGMRTVRDDKECLSLHGVEGSEVARFSPIDGLSDRPHRRAESDWSRRFYQQDGSSMEERFEQSSYPSPSARLHYNSSGIVAIEESLGSHGTILSRGHLLHGTRESYKNDGSFDSLRITSPDLFLQNIDAVAKQPGWYDAITRMVATRGDTWLSDYKSYQHRPEAQQILETAMTAMPLDQVQRHRLALEDSQANLLKQDPSAADSKAGKETKMFLELFRFRERMLEDGLLVARQSDATNTTPALASQVWNDPRSRNYFSIDSNWIDWGSEQVQGLMGGRDTPLTRADLKLLLSRALYVRNLQPSEQTVQESLRSLEELRKQYSGISIIKGRNIVLGAHSGTLSSLANDDSTSDFIESSGDYHEFGKRALVERLLKEQGEGRSFTLIRPERENLGDESTRGAVMAKYGLSPEQATAVEEQFACRAATSKAPWNTFLFGKALEDASVDYETATRITKDLNRDPSALLDELRRAKADLLEHIKNTPPPFTFIFEGHGGPDAIYLSDGELAQGMSPSESKGTTKITVDELAVALREREMKFGVPKAGEHDIIVFQNCYSSNFVQRLGKLLEGGRVPLCIGAAEHNQPSLYLQSLDVGSLFMSEVVTLPEDPDSTIGDVLIRQYRDLGEGTFRHLDGSKPEVNTNPIIYAPDQSGVLQHIGFTPSQRRTSTT